METVLIESFTVTGNRVRTQNSREMNPETARIGNLWQSFYAGLARPDTQTGIYGVYTAYESDEQGEYDVVAGIRDVQEPAADTVTVPAGTYIKFQRSGPPVEAVMALWQEIWGFFQKKESPIRAFEADFEEYGRDGVAVYIGIKEAR